MKNRLKNAALLCTGIVLGATLFGGVAAYAADVIAERSTNTVYVDGQRVELEAYLIDGANYVKLREVGEAVGFNVYWNGAVQIESGVPYTGEAPAGTPTPADTSATQQQTPPTPSAAPGAYTISVDHWSREDFSRQANPAVFTATYDRALYNTIRQTMVDGTSGTPAYTMVAKGNDYSAVKNLIGRMEGVLRYEHYVPKNFTNYYEYLDYFAVSAEMPENYQAPFDFILPVIQSTSGMTDREKVEYLNDYLSTLLTYDKSKTAGVVDTFSQHTGELEAACGSYARAFKFLCAAADIPCISISTSNHTWNLVYVDGKENRPSISPAGKGGLRMLPSRIVALEWKYAILLLPPFTGQRKRTMPQHEDQRKRAGGCAVRRSLQKRTDHNEP